MVEPHPVWFRVLEDTSICPAEQMLARIQKLGGERPTLG